MSITADQTGDTLAVVGQFGIITSESSNPDKVFIDVDLATNSGLEIDGSKLLKAKVDGSSVTIDDPGGYLVASVTAALDDVTDVSITSVAEDEILAYDSGSAEWINQAVGISGTSTAGDDATFVAKTPSSPSTQSMAGSTHTHSMSGSTSVASDVHYHTINGPTGDEDTGTPSTTETIVQSLDATGDTTVSLVSLITETSGSYPLSTHTHSVGTLAVTFS